MNKKEMAIEMLREQFKKDFAGIDKERQTDREFEQNIKDVFKSHDCYLNGNQLLPKNRWRQMILLNDFAGKNMPSVPAEQWYYFYYMGYELGRHDLFQQQVNSRVGLRKAFENSTNELKERLKQSERNREECLKQMEVRKHDKEIF